MLVLLFALMALSHRPEVAKASTAKAVTFSTASPEVHATINLGGSDVSPLHPRQLTFDGSRNGLWFWTSTIKSDSTVDNEIYFYDIHLSHLQRWHIYSGDWSSMLLAGLAIAPNGDVWVGWNHHLVDFHPADGSYQTVELPASIVYPLPSAIVADRPTDLGVADLAVAQDGTIWIARNGALSLTSFSPTSRSFQERQLPVNAGDPARLVVGPDGHIFFTTNLSADHAGYSSEKTGDFDPRTGTTHVFNHAAFSIAVTAQGDLITSLTGSSFGIQRVTAAERASAEAQARSPVFQHVTLPFQVDDKALAVDVHGRIWASIAGQPRIAVLDAATGVVLNEHQYSAPSVPGGPTGAYVLKHIVAMASDSQGHLWYVRIGENVIYEVDG